MAKEKKAAVIKIGSLHKPATARNVQNALRKTKIDKSNPPKFEALVNKNEMKKLIRMLKQGETR